MNIEARTNWYTCALCNTGFWALDICGHVDTCATCCEEQDKKERIVSDKWDRLRKGLGF